jgi:hypothetical protein
LKQMEDFQRHPPLQQHGRRASLTSHVVLSQVQSFSASKNERAGQQRWGLGGSLPGSL